MSDFYHRNVAYGLKQGEFDDLPSRAKKKLVRLMARIAEQSYRRGFQHGTRDKHCVDPADFRFKRSLAKSPFTDTIGGRGDHSAVERLFMECAALREIGFSETSHRAERRCETCGNTLAKWPDDAPAVSTIMNNCTDCLQQIYKLGKHDDGP